MKIFKSKTDIYNYLHPIKAQNKSIGFVPTMGALHKGHISLVDISIKENDFTVVSIFVNPTQFDNVDDFEKYPVSLDVDMELLKNAGVDCVFIPNKEDLYNGNIKSFEYDFGMLGRIMEGKHRKGHFDGVATVVKLLFDATIPNKAYFGEKDFQQLLIVKEMVAVNKLDVEIIPCPIIREEDGLAMSSRNTRLSVKYRKEANFIYKSLKKTLSLSKTKSVAEIYKYINDIFAENDFLELEYFEIRKEKDMSEVKNFQHNVEYRFFIAAFIQQVRLIDNIKLLSLPL